MKFKNIVQKYGRKFLGGSVAVAAAVPMCVTAFAAGETAGVAVTSDMLAPLVNGITSNIGVILPVGITIFAIMIGIGLVPKLIKMFAHK